MLNALLSRKPARRLQKDQVKYILKGFGKNPLMLNLKLIAENARHWYSYDSIHHIEKKHLGVKENVKGQIALLFDRLSQKDNQQLKSHIISRREHGPRRRSGRVKRTTEAFLRA